MTQSARRLTVALCTALALLAPTAAHAATPAAHAATPVADGEFVIGGLLPTTGSLASLTPPMAAGIQLALNDINAAGGVLGKPVRYVAADTGDTADTAKAGAQALVNAKVDVVVGAASSGTTLAALPTFVAAGTPMISPSATSPELSSVADNGLFWRTAPSDTLQGRVLADVISKDGRKNVAILTIDDPYGPGLTTPLRAGLKAAGATSTEVTYAPSATSFTDVVAKVKASKPDAVVVVGFEETPSIITELVAQGLGPATVPTYFSDGNLSNLYTLPKGTLKGVKGTAPGSPATAQFRQRLLGINPALKDFAYAGEAYDAVVLASLAAIAHQSDAGIAAELQQVSRGGTVCTDVPTCVKGATAGHDIDYNGQSGPIDFDQVGDPSSAIMGVYQYGEDNTYTLLTTQSVR